MNQNTNKINNYQHLFVAAQALQNKYRQKIFTILVEKNSVSFNDFLKILDITRPKLAYHLNILMKNNIIINFYDKREGAKDHSFYELSLLGRGLRMGSLQMSQETTREPSTEIRDGQDEQKEKDEQVEKEGQDGYKEGVALKASTFEFPNFRTVRKMEFKSFEKATIKLSKNKISTFDKKETEYIDPFLEMKVKKISPNIKSRNKVMFPSSRLYYVMYKQPFKSVNFISYKH